MTNPSNYDKFPSVRVPHSENAGCRGWEDIANRLEHAMRTAAARGKKPTIAIECYVGVFVSEIAGALNSRLSDVHWVDAADAMLDASEIERLVEPDLGAGDPIFGRLTRLELKQFLSNEKVEQVREQLARTTRPVVICGTGASLIAPESDLLIYADLPRREAQLRQRRGQVSNLGVQNRTSSASLQYKRSFFIDWRVCDRQKQQTIGRWDFVIDTCTPDDPRMVAGEAFREGLAHCATRPFRVVPFFDPGPWGGQWMKEVCDLARNESNFAWCFDCVPEENSLLLDFGDVRLEVPALDLVLYQPRALLGEPVFARFGPEFPIRFDLLDTVGGGNLSLQVHPLTQYIQSQFGMAYTQDESYYLLDAKPDAVVYLGRKRDTKMDDMFAALEAAHREGAPFDASRFAAHFPAKKHDHFLIPAGTLHCSGRDSIVLEISATPYIFTFKLWDWDRMGLDGKPRPINLEHGRKNIRWDRDEEYTRRFLMNQAQECARGDGWREEQTGLHPSQFIETRRHWFTNSVPHDTGGLQDGSVNVLNLVEGREAVVESVDEAFEPFLVHYAETFIVPAAVGRYRVHPLGAAGSSSECATIKAFVRCRA